MHHSHFFAHLFRLKLINRWPLMRNVRTENVSEHSLQVGFVAHLLAVIENRLFDGQHQAAEIALLAIYHDASEALTGDLPTPIKYYNQQIADEYNKIEKLAQQKLLALLPEELHNDFKPLLESSQRTTEQQRLVKQADVVCAYLKCLEEMVAGNHEFKAAETVLQKRLADHQSPALDYFMRHFVPSFTLPPEEFSRHEQL